MFLNFTRRHQLDQPDYDLKYEYVPDALRMDLYKAAIESCEGTVGEYCIYRDASVSINRDSVRRWTAEQIRQCYNPDLFIEMMLSVDWHEVLSLAEFFVEEGLVHEDDLNRLFVYHNVGYRYDNQDGHIVVYYEGLVETTEEILDSDIPYRGVLDSVSEAKKALTKPEDIKLAHSVKNSVDAVEGYVKAWLDEKNMSVSNLGEAIKLIKKRELCPNHVIESLSQFYVFRHRTPNAGHGDPNVAPLSKADARLCLEMCTSFINYFYRKS